MTLNHEREIASSLLRALGDLWSATDYPESQDLSIFDEQELKEILGQWEHIRRACDRLYKAIREAHPELPGWDPIQKERPILGLED